MSGDEEPPAAGAPDILAGAAPAGAAEPERVFRHGLALRLFGKEGPARLRDLGKWGVLGAAMPILALASDVFQVFGGVASKGFAVFALLSFVLALLAATRPPWRETLAFPIVTMTAFALVCGVVSALQQATDSQKEGVAAKFVPGVAEARARLEQIVERLRGVDVEIDRLGEKIDCLPAATAERVFAEFERRGRFGEAREGGLERMTIIALAQRLKPEEARDFDRAVKELENAVAIALDVIARGKGGGNDGEFIDGVLARVAELMKKGRFDSGARAVDAALAELERRKAEQEKVVRRSRLALLEAGIRQDILRRDAVAVARRVEAVAAEQSGDRPVWSEAFREYQDRYYEEGDKKGVNFSLEIAIRLARRMLETAGDADERGTAGNLLGLALTRLGERESGQVESIRRLEEAVEAFREAREEFTRESVPLDWAVTQNNLGVALRALGERESGQVESIRRLEEAVAAFREALKEFSRKRVPLQWAATQNNLAAALQRLGERVPLQWEMTQNNLGVALRALGARESGAEKLEQAVVAYREALKEYTRARVPLQWAMTQMNLGNALARLGARESGGRKLEQAVAAYREALKERTRERVPLKWAATQNNLGNALRLLGERESGQVESIRRLDEAVAAYREALKERTRERVPLDWAMTQINLGVALETLGRRESGQVESIRRLEEAVAAYLEALKEWTIVATPRQYDGAQGNLARAQALLDARRKGGGR